jgi:outer membrane protein assembly factor BamB
MPPGQLAGIRSGCISLALLACVCGCKSSVSGRGPQIKWQFSADDGVVSTPALGEDGTIYFTTAKLLYALAPDGKMKWNYFPGAELGSSPMVGPDGSIYIVDAGCVLHALNPDGSKRWIAQLAVAPRFAGAPAPPCWRPATPALGAADLLFVGNFSGSLIAVDANSGMTTNQFQDVAGPDSPEIPETGSGVEGGGALQFFDSGGRLSWTVRLSDGQRTLNFRTAAITKGGVIAVAGWDGKFHVYDFDGRPKWEFAGDWTANPVIAADGTIYVGNFAGVVALGGDGAQIWKAAVPLAGAPALAADGTIYVPSQDVGKGKNGSNLFSLYALNPQGAIQWRLVVDALIEHGPTIAPDGTVYVGTNSDGASGVKPHSGTLYAIHESNGGLLRGGWPKSFGSLANDGRAPSAP